MAQEKQETAQENTAHHVELASSSNFAGISCINTNTITHWIIDSDASDHICNCLDHFLTYKDVSSSNHFFTIPNGTKIKVEKMGTVRLHDSLSLEDVFYVPCFKFNLLSVQKLCHTNNVFIHFTNDLCFLQGPSMRRPMLLGKRH